MPSIAVCLTCYNRCETTLRCLRGLTSAQLPNDFSLRVYLTDDASADGTAEAVRRDFPDVVLLNGDGSLYWGGGMRLAFGTAMAAGHDFYLWLNDDVELFPDVLVRLVEVYRAVNGGGKHLTLIVGATCEPGTEILTYSGVNRSGISPIKFVKVPPHPTKPVECVTMNGNVVLIPAGVASAVGNVDQRFTHAIGDFDYGLRAKLHGAKLWICPGFVGTCKQNAREARWESSRYSLRERIKHLSSPLGLPFGGFITFAYRHGGARGVFFALWGYRRVLLPAYRPSSHVEAKRNLA